MRIYLFFINLALITVLVFLSVKTGYMTLETSLKTEIAPKTSRETAESTIKKIRPPHTSYSAISNRNLFQTVNMKQAGKQAPPPVIEELPETPTQLKVKLLGTAFGEGIRSMAVIRDEKDRSQDVYYEKYTIQGADILRIEDQRVLLLVNGKKEYLEMADVKDSAKDGPPPAPIPQINRPAPGAFGSLPPGETRSVTVSRSEVDSALSDVTQIMRQAKVRPHFQNGKPDGIMITRIKPDSIFTQLGLRSGDVITGVDGKRIESVDDALGFYNSLRSSSSLKLQIKRRGREQSLEYNIE